MTIGSLNGPRYGMLRCRCSPRPMLAAAFALGGVKIPGAAASCISNSLSTFADLPNNQRIRLRQSLVDGAERSQQRFNRPCEILTRGWFHIKRDGLGTASCPGWQPPRISLKRIRQGLSRTSLSSAAATKISKKEYRE